MTYYQSNTKVRQELRFFFLFFKVFFTKSKQLRKQPRNRAPLVSLFSISIPAMFGLARRGKGCAGYDIMSLRKRRADREAAEASSWRKTNTGVHQPERWEGVKHICFTSTMREMYTLPVLWRENERFLLRISVYFSTWTARGRIEEREDGGFGWRERWPSALLCSL